MSRIAPLPTARPAPDDMAATMTAGKLGVSWVNAQAVRNRTDTRIDDRPASGASFFALLPGVYQTGTTVVPVIDGDGDQMLGDELLLVTTDPRRLPITEAVGVLDPAADQLMDLRGLLAQGDRLACLTPAGPVIPTDTDLAHLHMSPRGWTIAGWEPISAVLGPQADQLCAAITRFEDLRGDGPAALAYAAAVNAQYHGPHWLGRPHAEAAEAALTSAGVDGQWWLYTSQSCVMGAELLALAARDLIGTVPGWTWPAYSALVEPWRNAYGWPHPDDRAALRLLQAAAALRSARPW